MPAGPAQVSITATAWPSALSNTVIVFEPELVTKPAWSAIGRGGAMAENTGLKVIPSATDSRYLSVSQKSGACWPVRTHGDVEAGRRVRDDERDVSMLALHRRPGDREAEPGIAAPWEAPEASSRCRRAFDASTDARLTLSGYSAPFAVTADTEAIVNVSLAASGGRGCR